MTPPTVQFISAAKATTDLIRFTSGVNSPSNEFNVDHINLHGDSSLDGRGLTNSIDLRGSDSPDAFRMWFDNTSERNTALAIFQSFSTITLLDDSDSVSYTLSVSVYDSFRLQFLCPSGEDAVWVSANQYTVIGQ